MFEVFVAARLCENESGIVLLDLEDVAGDEGSVISLGDCPTRECLQKGVELVVQYDRLLSSVEGLNTEALFHFLASELPGLWIEEYQEMTSRPTHIVAATFEGFQYL